ncbi:GTP cyclohydrolase 1 feedback regulatory protein [Aphelenchoides besseyi]|nr:GTP cyclohydrolase 1 feedback regulatory protein [Aphelenchoides besseyi]
MSTLISTNTNNTVEYILVSTQIRCETGPCVVGDEESDPVLMATVDGSLVSRLGNTYSEYVTQWPVRRVLNRLAQSGFRVIAMSGIGQTWLVSIWTLGRECKPTSLSTEL